MEGPTNPGHGQRGRPRPSPWPTLQRGGCVSPDLLKELGYGHHWDAVAASRARFTGLARRIGRDEKVASLLRDRSHGLQAGACGMSFQHLPPNRPSPHYRLARETDVHPLAKVAGRRNPCDLGYGDVGEVERIGGLLDEAVLRLGDDAIASGRGDDRRQVRAVRFRALLGGNGEAVGQLDELGALPLIDTAIIEHPIERVKILKQRFVGRRVVCVGDDAGQVAGWGPRRFPPQRSWTGGIRDMADRRGSGVAPHVGGEVARELGSCPGVGERPMLQAQLDSESGARDAELVSPWL